MTATFTPPVPEAIRKPWSLTLQGGTALGGLIAAIGCIALGRLGIEDIESC